MVRQIRTRSENGGVVETSGNTLKKPPTRAIKSVLDPEASLIDSLVTLKNDVDALSKQYRKATGAKLSEIAQLESELLQAAKDQKKKHFRGTLADVTIAASTSSKIDPRTFLKWLKKIGMVQRFYDHASIGVGDAKKEFGEKPLVEAGVLVTTVTEYARLKIREKG